MNTEMSIVEFSLPAVEFASDEILKLDDLSLAMVGGGEAVIAA